MSGDKALSRYALDLLVDVARLGRIPSHMGNPGAWNKLMRKGLVRPIEGAPRITYELTPEGRAFVGLPDV